MATSAKGASKNASSNGGEAPSKSKTKLILIIVLAVVLAAGGGGAAAWFFLGKNDNTVATAPQPKPVDNKPPVFLPLEPFTVNLQSDEHEQYLQVTMTLQVGEPEQGDLFKLYMPEVRNRMLLLLSSKAAKEILTPEGKKKLAEDIIATLQKPFVPNGPTQAVNNVFFTSFVIQ